MRRESLLLIRGRGGGRNYSNLSVKEIQALRNLKSSRDIIKEADKGSAVVVCNRKDYCREAYNHLNDAVVYEKLEQDSLSEVSDQVKEALQPLLDKGYISSKNVEYLVVSRPLLGRFYLLPKIHERLENVPGRPVNLTKVRPRKGFQSFLIFILSRW